MNLRVADIPIDVQRHWLAGLAAEWRRINDRDLSGRLRVPGFVLIDHGSRLGQWDGKSRMLAVSVRHLTVDTWAEVSDTLRHEMAHQVVQELLAGEAAPAHGELFARACALLRIPASATGPAATAEQLRVLARIRKLLTLGNSENEHEAQAAMAQANKLLLRHNIDRSAVDGGQRSEEHYSYRRVGDVVGRISAERKLLSNILQDHFFVRCVWIVTRHTVTDKPLSFLEIVGQHDNLELATYTHDYLVRLLDELWDRYRRRKATSGKDRGAYRVGVLMGFKEHLAAQSVRYETEGLVWLGDPGADALYAKRHPRTSSLSAGSYRGGSAHDQGRAEGRNIRVRPGLGTTPSLSRGRLLPG